MTTPRPLLLLVISVVRPNRAGAFPSRRGSVVGAGAEGRGGGRGGGRAPRRRPPPPPAAPRARRAAQRPPDGGRGAEGGARLGVRVVRWGVADPAHRVLRRGGGGAQ